MLSRFNMEEVQMLICRLIPTMEKAFQYAEFNALAIPEPLRSLDDAGGIICGRPT
jgi:hypothetical protein